MGEPRSVSSAKTLFFFFLDTRVYSHIFKTDNPLCRFHSQLHHQRPRGVDAEAGLPAPPAGQQGAVGGAAAAPAASAGAAAERGAQAPAVGREAEAHRGAEGAEEAAGGGEPPP